MAPDASAEKFLMNLARIDPCMQAALAAAEERLREADSNRASLEAQLRAAQLQASSAAQVSFWHVTMRVTGFEMTTWMGTNTA